MATTDTEVSVSQRIALEKENPGSAASVPVQVGTHFFRQQYLFAFATQAEVLQYVRTQTIGEELARLPEIFAAWQAIQPRVADLIVREAGLLTQFECPTFRQGTSRSWICSHPTTYSRRPFPTFR